MGYKNGSFLRAEVKIKINVILKNIIADINYPYSNRKTTSINNNVNTNLSVYEDFFARIRSCITDYFPSENETTALTLIGKIPNTVSNISKIRHNKKIIEAQNNILRNYFSDNDNNIRNKIIELKSSVNEAIRENNNDILDEVLEGFDNWIRSGFLKDINELFQLFRQERG